MEASSQIQNLLCLSLLHLCSSFFHYLTLNQVSEVGTTDRNGGNYLIAIIHRGPKIQRKLWKPSSRNERSLSHRKSEKFDAETLYVFLEWVRGNGHTNLIE